MLTASTLPGPDWVVRGPDRFGFRTFSRLLSICKAWNAVRDPPRARKTPSSSEGLFALTCGHGLWWRPSDARCAGFGLAAAVAYSGVWGGGFKTLAGGSSACCRAVTCFLVPVLVGVGRGGQHLFIVLGCGHNMTSLTLVRNYSRRVSLGHHGEPQVPVCPTKGGVDTVHLRLLYGSPVVKWQQKGNSDHEHDVAT